MADGPATAVLTILRRMVAGPDAGDHAADGALLARFAVQRDEAAFAELLRRHGPMVLETHLNQDGGWRCLERTLAGPIQQEEPRLLIGSQSSDDDGGGHGDGEQEEAPAHGGLLRSLVNGAFLGWISAAWRWECQEKGHAWRWARFARACRSRRACLLLKNVRT
jgi:hypothetical protein